MVAGRPALKPQMESAGVTRVWPNDRTAPNIHKIEWLLEPETGLEPVTSSLKKRSNFVPFLRFRPARARMESQRSLDIIQFAAVATRLDRFRIVRDAGR